MANKCGNCGRFVSITETIKCEKCSIVYHKACANISGKGNTIAKWHCPECCRSIGKFKNRQSVGADDVYNDESSDTSPNKHAGYATPDPDAMPTIHHQSQRSGTGLQMVMEELRAVREDIQLFRKEMEAALKASVQACNSRIDGLEARIVSLEERAITHTSGSGSVEGIIEELRHELNDRDQELLLNDIEISNMPETNSENPIHIVKTICLKIGVTIEERDIVSAERVGGRQLIATDAAGAERRPRPLVVRLARRDLRDRLLGGARVRRGTTTADLNMSGPPRRFYLNERLTKTNRQLFRKAREAAAGAGWKFVWTKRGRILACKKPGDATHRIRVDTDIFKVFGNK